MTASKQQLRKELRAMRRVIPKAEYELAATSLCDKVTHTSNFQSATNIAVYWPHDAEIDTLPLLKTALAQRKNCYLPVLQLKNIQTLAFALYTPQTPLLKNRYSILEPDLSYAPIIEPQDLDIIFLPIVGFDRNGWRLGRGGGFYDATCADLDRTGKEQWPQLIGLSYAYQEVAKLPLDSWDRQLNMIITEQEVIEIILVSE